MSGDILTFAQSENAYGRLDVIETEMEDGSTKLILASVDIGIVGDEEEEFIIPIGIIIPPRTMKALSEEKKRDIYRKKADTVMEMVPDMLEMRVGTKRYLGKLQDGVAIALVENINTLKGES